MEGNVFEMATRAHLRFETKRGNLTTEDLWELPLTSKDGFDLDAVARTANAGLRQAQEESFVAVRKNPARARLELALETVKAVIAWRQAANEAAQQRAAKQAERERLLRALDSKQEAALQALTADEARARLQKLDAELEAPAL